MVRPKLNEKKREQHTISLNDSEKKSIDEAAGDEGFSPYARRQLLQIAKEEKESRKGSGDRSGKGNTMKSGGEIRRWPDGWAPK